MLKPIRGAVFNPFNLDAVNQKHWQAAARHCKFAIVGANYFGVNSAEFSIILNEALKHFSASAK